MTGGERITRKWLEELADPDVVGQSEYRAIYETLQDMFEQSASDCGLVTPAGLVPAEEDPGLPGLLLAILDEYAETAMSLKAQLQQKLREGGVVDGS